MAQWGGQIRTCINRHASAPRGLRQGGRVILALTVGRDGTMLGAGIAAFSGQAALDQPRYAFQLPITLDLR